MNTDEIETHSSFDTERFDSSPPGIAIKLGSRKDVNTTTDAQLIAKLLLLRLDWLVHKAVNKVVGSLDD